MFSTKYNLLHFIIFIIIAQIQSLVELPPAEDNEIAITESVLRSTVNSIFSILNLKHGKYKERLRDFSTIHNFFVSITLQDHDNLKEIAKLAKVDYIDNNTRHFITQLNEVLNEDKKSTEALDDVYVNTHVETFIETLEHLKNMYGFKSNVGNFDISAEILKYLSTDVTGLEKYTKSIKKTNNSDGYQSDNEFWKPSGRRIYKGHRVKIKRFPFMASVQFFKKFQCAGSIIKSDLVITSGSCLQLAWNNRFFRENPSFLSVQVGCDFYEGGDENIAVLEVYFHPGYNPKNLNDNLAVMRLTRALHFQKKVKRIKKIDIDRNAWNLPETTAGITIVGWGARGTNNILESPWSNRLSFADLDYYPTWECQEVYSKEYVTKRNFCAGFFSKGGGACNRDVGGPGVVGGILVGVVSFGSPNCGAPDAPTVFTKVGYYAKWIDEIMEQDVPSRPAQTTLKPYKYTYDFESLTRTTTPFTILPIMGTKSDQTEPIPIPDADNLRILKDQELFKEFIETIFDNEEVKDYLNKNEADLLKSSEIKQTNDKEITLKQLTRSKQIPTTEPTTKAYKNQMTTFDESFEKAPAESQELVTAFEKFDTNYEDVTVANMVTKYTDLDPAEEDKREAEQDIAKIIDEIDIDEILESITSKEDSKNHGVTPNIPHSESKLKLESKSVETYESSSDENINSASLMEMLSNAGKQRMFNKEENEGNPIGPVIDLTFRQNSSGLLELLSSMLIP